MVGAAHKSNTIKMEGRALDLATQSDWWPWTEGWGCSGGDKSPVRESEGERYITNVKDQADPSRNLTVEEQVQKPKAVDGFYYRNYEGSVKWLRDSRVVMRRERGRRLKEWKGTCCRPQMDRKAFENSSCIVTGRKPNAPYLCSCAHLLSLVTLREEGQEVLGGPGTLYQPPKPDVSARSPYSR